jgi:hypothetical protein
MHAIQVEVVEKPSEEVVELCETSASSAAASY